MKYLARATYSVCLFLEVEAESLEEAKQKALEIGFERGPGTPGLGDGEVDPDSVVVEVSE